ncbi:MAG: hypothetical protein EOM20_10720 [Spartobacteria bacterium]|nr:hypothetical protein [Spartobacteria bacterium]
MTMNDLSSHERKEMSADAPSPLKRRLRDEAWAVLEATHLFDPSVWRVKRLMRLLLLAVLVVVLVGVGRHGMVRIHEHQVGVRLNNLTGKLSLAPHAGYQFYIPYLANMYLLDKTLHRLELTWAQRGGDPRDVRLKVADGSQVSLDLTLNFKINPGMAVEILRKSGREGRFAHLWIESLARNYALQYFGQLTMEQFYDANQRRDKAEAVREGMNRSLRDEGIEIVAVIPGEYRFYAEYEKIIQEKKLADQQVEEQQAQARAAQEDQERRIIEKKKEIEARRMSFDAEMAARFSQAGADAEKHRRESDGQYRRKLLQADTMLYTAQKQAEAALEQGRAEAEGLTRNREAMQGEGGLNMVALEYAHQLQKMRITGTPIARDPALRQLAVNADEISAASGGRQ